MMGTTFFFGTKGAFASHGYAIDKQAADQR